MLKNPEIPSVKSLRFPRNSFSGGGGGGPGNPRNSDANGDKEPSVDNAQHQQGVATNVRKRDRKNNHVIYMAWHVDHATAHYRKIFSVDFSAELAQE